MNYNNLGITLCTKCNAKCKICCMSSSPDCDEVLEIDDIKNFIGCLVDNEKIKVISFSGGEVFLYYEKLKQLVQYVKGLNKECTVITNGYWANDLEKSVQKLHELKLCGLSGLTISYDEFHNEFVSQQCIENVLLAAKAVMLPISIQMVVTKNTNFAVMLENIKDKLQDVKINCIPCFPVGNAKETIQDDLYIREETIQGLLCRKDGAFSITSDGNIWPCCSPYITKTELIIGNIKNGINAEEALKKISRNAVLWALRNYGFDFFVKIAVDKAGIVLPEKVISSCELCAILFNKQNISKILPYVLDEIELKNVSNK